MTSAEPGLDDGDVDVGGSELGERGCRQHLELRGAALLCCRAHATDGCFEVRLARRVRGSARSSRAHAVRNTRRRRDLRLASSSSIVRVTVDLPFVPTTWIDG